MSSTTASPAASRLRLDSTFGRSSSVCHCGKSKSMRSIAGTPASMNGVWSSSTVPCVAEDTIEPDAGALGRGAQARPEPGVAAEVALEPQVAVGDEVGEDERLELLGVRVRVGARAADPAASGSRCTRAGPPRRRTGRSGPGAGCAAAGGAARERPRGRARSRRRRRWRPRTRPACPSCRSARRARRPGSRPGSVPTTFCRPPPTGSNRPLGRRLAQSLREAAQRRRAGGPRPDVDLAHELGPRAVAVEAVDLRRRRRGAGVAVLVSASRTAPVTRRADDQDLQRDDALPGVA